MLNFRTRRRLDVASAYNFNSNDNNAIQFKKCEIITRARTTINVKLLQEKRLQMPFK